MRAAQSRRWILLGCLLMAHSANNAGMALAAHYLREPTHRLWGLLYLALYGVTTSQPVLLAMWAVFGRQHLALRAVLPIGILGLITVDPFILLGRTWHQRIFHVLPTFWGYQTALFAASAALFIIARASLGWRAVPMEAMDRAPSQLGRSKLSLRDLFGLTATCALGLAALRFYSTHISAVWGPLTRDSVHALVALTFLPMFLADKRPARATHWLAAALAADLIVSTALVYRGRSVVEFLINWSAFSIGFFGSVVLSLLVVRLVGYRLLPVRQRQESPGKAAG